MNGPPSCDDVDGDMSYEELFDYAFGRELQLSKPGASRFHKFIESIQTGTFRGFFDQSFGESEFSKRDPTSNNLADAQVFVIEHDWAAALSGATDFEGGEIKMPYPMMAFEFCLNKINVVATASETPGKPLAVSVVMHAAPGPGWVVFAEADVDRQGRIVRPDKTPLIMSAAGWRVASFLCEQIRAIAIALDAEVAVAEVTRAPHRLNRARERRGKLPLRDFHTLRLNRRSRLSPLPEYHVSGERSSPRLHFVRGHWRHFERHKTWIKWFLRGDADLGFIEKEYRL